MTTDAFLLGALSAASVWRIIGYVLLGVVALIILLFVLFWIVFVVICLVERQYLVGDIEPVNEPYPYPVTPYWRVTRKTALQIGLEFVGDFATKKKTGLVKVLEALFVSPDRQTIISICSGSSAVAKDHRTILRTRLNTGQVLESSDMHGTQDHSGVIERATLLNAGIAELMGFHRERIDKSGAIPVPFNAGAVRMETDRISWERGERWVKLGLARWVDSERKSIRMTIRGTLKHAAQIFQSGDLDKHRKRMNIRRAGSLMRE